MKSIGYKMMMILVLLSMVTVSCKKDEEPVSNQVSATDQVDKSEEKEKGDVSQEKKLDDQVIGDSQQFEENVEDPSVWNFNSKLDGQWSVDEPFFNPMGFEEAYSSIDFYEDDEFNFVFMDDKFYERERRVFGDYWRLYIPFNENFSEEDNLKFPRDLRRHIIAIGGSFDGLTEDGYIFTVFDGKQKYRGELEADRSEYIIHLVKEVSLEVGQTLVLNPGQMDQDFYRFTLYNDEQHFLSGSLSLDKHDFDVEVKQNSQEGPYKRRIVYSRNFDSEIDSTYRVDALPLDGGVSYWEISWDDEDYPEEITLLVEDLGPMDKISSDKNLGGIQIGSKFAGSVTLEPVGNDDLYLDHPSFEIDSAYADKTAEGDYLITVPAGLWKAHIRPLDSATVNSLTTTLIPVSAGQLTIIEVPLSTENAIANHMEAFDGQSGMTIDKVVDNGDRVSFDFTLVDRISQDVLPTLDNTFIKEGGKDVVITNISPVMTPPSVVLLLDSSGSMKGQLSATLDAARDFINQLPEDTYIELIDFDDAPKLLEGTSVEEASDNLEVIKVGGSTALYDSIALGLDLLEGRERATLVAFTDGEDENHSVPGSGSKTTKEECLSLVSAKGIQVMTIGFGEGHDGTTLYELALAGYGQYFPADDTQALEEVFKAINDKLNSTYTASYIRPQEAAPSDVPVVNIVVDVSGSMNSSFDESCGYRIDKVKKLFHDFVETLPENTQIQLMTFSEDVKIEQMMTSDKHKIYSSLGELTTGGGTEILGSVSAGYETLKAFPSSKKVMIYLTDAALGVDSDQEEKLDEILRDIGLDKMNVLWLGLGEDLDPDDFVHAAELSGGSYVLGEDMEKISEEVKLLMDRIYSQKEEAKTTISIQVEKKDDMGLIVPYAASGLASLSPLPVGGKYELSDAVTYVDGGELRQYDPISAKFISGDDLPNDGINILKRIEMDEKASNDAMSMGVKELVFMSELCGLEAPRGQRFLGVITELSNILPEQEVVVYPDGSGHPSSWINSNQTEGVVKKAKIPYEIPNVFSHMALSYNNSGVYPLSQATWITSMPIVVPGNSDIRLNPDETLRGAMVFLVPDQAMDQVSLNYYDTNYGHIQLALVGEMKPRDMELDTLPMTASGNLSDTFTLKVTGYSNQEEVFDMAAAGEDTVFRIIEGQFQSKVQANMDIDTSERLMLSFPTNQGEFLTPLSEVTELLPMGMTGQQLVSPGALNDVKFAFQIPEALENDLSRIFIDLKDDDVYIKASEGSSYNGSGNEGHGSHDYANVTINRLIEFEGDIQGRNSNYVIADITIEDIKDGYASRGILGQLKLVEEGFDIETLEAEGVSYEKKMEMALHSGGLSSFASSADFENEHLIEADDMTGKAILGLDDTSIIYDGMKRRGFLIFKLGNNQGIYSLQSSFYHGLKVYPTKGDFDTGLLVEKQELDLNNTYQENLTQAISSAITTYRMEHPQESFAKSLLNTDLDEGVEDRINVPVPMTSVYGIQKLDEIESVNELIELIETLTIVENNRYGSGEPFLYEHNPAAVLAQGWGTVNDINHLALTVMTRLGYEPEAKLFKLNDKGLAYIDDFVDSQEANADIIGVLSYRENQIEKTLALPFMTSLENLTGKGVYVFDEIEHISKTVTLNVEYLLEPSGKNLGGQVGDAASALGGGSVSNEPEWKNVMTEYLSKDLLSRDAIDIGVTITPEGYSPILYTADGLITSEEGIDKNEYKIIGMKVILRLPDNEAVHEEIFEDGMEVEDVFITLGANLPNLTEEAYEVLVETADQVYDTSLPVDTLSALRWMGRKSINSFIILQSSYEKELCDAYGLIRAHVNRESCFIVTQRISDRYALSLDLLKPVTSIIGDSDFMDEHEEAVKSYRIMAGLHASILEGQVIDKGYSVKEIWEAMDSSGEIIHIGPGDDLYDESYLSKLGMTDKMVEHIIDTRKHIFIQSKPSLILGQERWAWIEIDPYTYETISLLDSFEHGAMSSRSIVEKIEEKAKYYFGQFVGIESSVWSVCSFTLEITDYEAMKKAAREYAEGIKGYLNAKAFENFSDGYEAGVKFYFDHMN